MSLNKSQTRSVNNARNAVTSMGETGKGIAARSLSAEYRSAMRKTQQQAILQVAQDLGITDHADFKI